MDIYLCEIRIDYNETNIKCSLNEKIAKKTWINK